MRREDNHEKGQSPFVLLSTLVLLAFDWPDGAREDFLGFAVSRVPGFRNKEGQLEDKSWLPNRVGFDGPVTGKMHADFPSNTSPLQKFMWWDARIDDPDRGKEFTYSVFPVVGTPDAIKMLEECGTIHKLRIPQPEENGIGTYFNRAVVSSQAFSKKFGDLRRVRSGGRAVVAGEWPRKSGAGVPEQGLQHRRSYLPHDRQVVGSSCTPQGEEGLHRLQPDAPGRCERGRGGGAGVGDAGGVSAPHARQHHAQQVPGAPRGHQAGGRAGRIGELHH